MKHCYHCGGSLIPTNNCPQCSAPTQPHYAFCTECGCRLIKPAVQATRLPKEEKKRYQVTIPSVYIDALRKTKNIAATLEQAVKENIDRINDVEPDVIPRWASGESVKVSFYLDPDIAAKLDDADMPSRKMRSLLLEHLGLPINGYGSKLDVATIESSPQLAPSTGPCEVIANPRRKRKPGPKPGGGRAPVKKYQVVIPKAHIGALQGIGNVASLAEQVVKENIDRIADVETDIIPRWAGGESIKLYLYLTPDIAKQLDGVEKPARKIRSLLLEHLGLPINGYGPRPVKANKKPEKSPDEYYQEKPISSNGRKLARILFTHEQFDRLRILWGNYPQNDLADFVNANALRYRDFGAITMPRGKATPEDLSAVTVWIDDAVHEYLKRGNSFLSEKVRWMLFEAEGAPA